MSSDGLDIELPGVFFDSNDIIDLLEPEDMRRLAAHSRHSESLVALETFARSLISAPANDLEFGLIGSVGLGLEAVGRNEPHDWDVVLTSGAETRRALVESLQNRAIEREDSRVSEYGKSWLIRQWVDGRLFCPFFRDTDTSPLAISDWNAGLEEFHGVISDPWDSVLVPGRAKMLTAQGEVSLVMVGLRSRGDFREGAAITARGRRCQITTRHAREEAIVVVDEIDPIRVEGPWSDYYG